MFTGHFRVNIEQFYLNRRSNKRLLEAIIWRFFCSSVKRWCWYGRKTKESILLHSTLTQSDTVWNSQHAKSPKWNVNVHTQHIISIWRKHWNVLLFKIFVVVGNLKNDINVITRIEKLRDVNGKTGQERKEERMRREVERRTEERKEENKKDPTSFEYWLEAYRTILPWLHSWTGWRRRDSNGKRRRGEDKVWRKGKEKISAIERRTVKYCIFVEALSFWSLRDSIIIITVIYWLKKKMVEGVRWGNEKGKERRNGEYRWMWDRKGKERELKTD